MTSFDANAWHAAMAPYARYLPGLAFLQGLGAGGQPVAPAAQWVAPVFDVEELERRVRDLKAVHFWLEQNARAVQATIQALEVQKLTLATLQGMNVSLGQVAQSVADAVAGTAPRARPAAAAGADAAAGAGPASAATADAAASQSVAGGPDIDPVRVWRALTEQFQTIAAQALRDMTLQAAQAAAAGLVGTGSMPARAATPTPPAAQPGAAAAASAARRAGGAAVHPPAREGDTPAPASLAEGPRPKRSRSATTVAAASPTAAASRPSRSRKPAP